MSRVFISYVREDASSVDRLCQGLREFGVEYWLDRNDIQPGEHWKDAIRSAIRKGSFFVACFSTASLSRRSGMNEELTLAIEELRQRPRNCSWFIPVVFSGEVPDWEVDATRTLRSFQWVDVDSGRWDSGMERLIRVLAGSSKHASHLIRTREILRTVRERYPSCFGPQLSALDNVPVTINDDQSGAWTGTWRSTETPSENGTLSLELYRIGDIFLGRVEAGNSILSPFGTVEIIANVENSEVRLWALRPVPVGYSIEGKLTVLNSTPRISGSYAIEDYDFGVFEIGKSDP